MYISGVQKGDRVVVWERVNGKRVEKTYPAPYYFYVESEDPKLAIYTSIYGKRLERVDFSLGYDFHSYRSECQRRGMRLYESDISPVVKILSEHYHNAEIPDLHVSLLDIEVDYREKVWDKNHIIKLRVKPKVKGDRRVLGTKWIEITCDDLRNAEDVDKCQVWDEIGEKWVSARHSDYFYTGQAGFSSVMNPYAPINAVALHNMWQDKSYVLVVPPPDWDPSEFDESLRELAEVIFCRDEEDLLKRMLDLLEDADVLSGWNSENFDIPYIAKRLEMYGQHLFKRLSFQGAMPPRYREFEQFGRTSVTVDLSGRVHLDYMNLFKKYEMSQRPSYKLESIAEEILPKLPKLEYEGSLARLYRNDFNWFVRYNIRDTEILVGFERTLAYIALANVMAHTSCALFTDIFGTLKLTDYAIVNYCHYVKNVIVPDWVEREDGSIKGAYVLVPQVGMHDWIASIDINSLYPSAIRSINISPETVRGQFLNHVDDWEEIYQCSNKRLVVRWENGQEDVRTAREWREYLKELHYSVSGYGTIYDQNEQGVIPAILERWYAQRKEYQAEKAKWQEQAEALLAPYK